MPAYCPPLPGFPKTYAKWPVWSGSVREVICHALDRAEAWRRFREAKKIIKGLPYRGRNNVLAVFEALMEIMHFDTGECFPAYDTIGVKAGVSDTTVWRAIRWLKAHGFIWWHRRYKAIEGQGFFEVFQDSNAYVFLPPSHWRGYRDAPPPHPDTWCKTEPMPSLIVQAKAFASEGGTAEAVASLLESDPADELAQSLAGKVRLWGLGVLLEVKGVLK
jgi:hypothetical protein